MFQTFSRTPSHFPLPLIPIITRGRHFDPGERPLATYVDCDSDTNCIGVMPLRYNQSGRSSKPNHRCPWRLPLPWSTADPLFDGGDRIIRSTIARAINHYPFNRHVICVVYVVYTIRGIKLVGFRRTIDKSLQRLVGCLPNVTYFGSHLTCFSAADIPILNSFRTPYVECRFDQKYATDCLSLGFEDVLVTFPRPWTKGVISALSRDGRKAAS
jgi:hypothetical protein